MKYYIFLVLLILGLNLDICLGNRLDMKITRLEIRQDVINLNDKINVDDLLICQNENLNSLLSNRQQFEQICFNRDIIYQIQMMMGVKQLSQTKNKSLQRNLFRLNIDLHSPWTWLLNKECKQCETNEMPSFSKSYEKMESYLESCDGKCLKSANKRASIDTTNEKVNKNLSGKSVTIWGQNEMLLGEFVYENVYGIVYDQNKTKTLEEILEADLGLDSFKDYEEIISLKSAKILAVKRIIGYETYEGNGALGMGFIDEDNLSPKDYQSDTNVLDMILDKYGLPSIFGLYLHQSSSKIKDFVLTLGGFDKYYAHKDAIEPRYIPLSKDRGANWMLDIASLSLNLGYFSSRGIHQTMDFEEGIKAVLTTSASYLGLPKKQLFQLAELLGRIEGAQCSIVDKNSGYLYCRGMRRMNIVWFRYSLQFKEQSQQIFMDAWSIIKECTSDQGQVYKSINDIYSQGDFLIYDCLFNVRASQDGLVVLGEPFMMQHYTILDLDSKRIGFLPAYREIFWEDQYSKGWFSYLINWIIGFFIFGLLSIFCMKNLTKKIKKIKRFFQQRNFKSEVIEVQSLNDSNMHNEDVETAMKDEINTDLSDIMPSTSKLDNIYSQKI